MKIPRCRATVSEDIAAGHWGNLGRPDCRKSDAGHVLTRKPGDRREPSTLNPFACKGGVMRLFFCLVFWWRCFRRNQNQSCRSTCVRGQRGTGHSAQRRCSRFHPDHWVRWRCRLSKHYFCFAGASACPGFTPAEAEVAHDRHEALTVELHLAPVAQTVVGDGHAQPGPD